jgi:hypothetical protein
MDLTTEIIWLFIIALPISCVAWTVTHEEVFREPREYCVSRSREGRTVYIRKFFYLFTCEYCFSHYVTVIFLIITDYQLLMTGWRGYLIAFFAIVWIANVYMSIFALIRQGIKKEKTEIKLLEKEKDKIAAETENIPPIVDDL